LVQKRRSTKPYEGYPWHEQHKEELKEKARKYRAENPEYLKRNAEKARRDRLENPEFYRAREFAREMKKYGVTVEWYRDKLIAQNGLCAICQHLSHHHGTIQRLQVDHNHQCCDVKTKSCGECVRGLLCADCNINLSYLEKILKDIYGLYEARWDSWTSKALKYLTQYELTAN
jgi:hypothetical protein